MCSKRQGIMLIDLAVIGLASGMLLAPGVVTAVAWAVCTLAAARWVTRARVRTDRTTFEQWATRQPQAPALTAGPVIGLLPAGEPQLVTPRADRLDRVPSGL